MIQIRLNPKYPLPTHCVALLPFLLALSEGQLLGQVVLGPHLPPLPWLVPHELDTGGGVSKVVVFKPGATGQGVVSSPGLTQLVTSRLKHGSGRHWQFTWSPSTPSPLVLLLLAGMVDSWWWWVRKARFCWWRKDCG